MSNFDKLLEARKMQRKEQRLYDQKAKHSKLTMNQIEVLITIYDNNDITASKIVELTYFHNSMVSHTLTKLMKMELVELYSDRQDRRITRTRLTAKSKRICKQLRQN